MPPKAGIRGFTKSTASGCTKSGRRCHSGLLKKGTVPFQRVIFPQQIGTAKRDCPLFQRAVTAETANMYRKRPSDASGKSGAHDRGPRHGSAAGRHCRAMARISAHQQVAEFV